MKITKEITYTKIIRVLLLIMFAALFIVGVAYTGINLSIYSETVILAPTNPLYIFLALLFGWLLFKGLGRLYDKYLFKVNPKIITAVSCVIVYVVSVIWILIANNLVQSDAKFLVELAEAITAGEQPPFLEDDYITFFPYQLGFVTVLRVLIKVFGSGNYDVFRMVLALDVVVIVASGSGIIKHMTTEEKSGKIRFFYCFLMILCLPLYFYTPMIYGDIPYAALSMFAIYLMLEGIRKPSVLKYILLFIVCGANYLIKSYALITLAAMVIYLLIGLFSREKRKACIIMLATVIAGTFLCTKLNYFMYRDYTAGGYDSLPLIANVTMGANDDNGNAGWCNFYHQITFVECDYDAKLTTLQSLADLKGVVGYWAHHPLYAIDFFYRKINYQWNTPMFESLNMICSHEAEGQGTFGKLMFESDRAWWNLAQITKIFQIIVYASVFGSLFISVFGKKDERLDKYALMIVVFGNFLFSIVWEAKTRYVFPAFIMIIPFAAMAIGMLQDTMGQRKNLPIREYLSGTGKSEIKYPGIDLLKIVMAVSVVAIHVIPHASIENKYIYQIVEGLISPAVGFFFLAAGFLLGKKLANVNSYEEKRNVVIRYLKRIFKLYVIWNIVYLPLAIYEYIFYGYSFGKSLWLYIRGFVFIGEHYNSWILWYLLSSIFACLVVLLLLKLNVKESTWLVVSALAFLLDHFLDYVIKGNFSGSFFDLIRNVLTWTIQDGRVLGGICFIPLGIYLSMKKPRVTSGILLWIFGYGLSFAFKFEWFPYMLESIGLLIIGTNLNLRDSKLWVVCRKTSTLVYFLHMWIWTILYVAIYGSRENGVLMFVTTLSATLLISVVAVLIGMRKRGEFK